MTGRCAKANDTHPRLQLVWGGGNYNLIIDFNTKMVPTVSCNENSCQRYLNDHWAETSQLFASSLGCKALPSPLKCKNEYLVFALEEKTSAHAVVDSIVLAFLAGSKGQGVGR